MMSSIYTGARSGEVALAVSNGVVTLERKSLQVWLPRLAVVANFEGDVGDNF
jgi:hypothetical protein